MPNMDKTLKVWNPDSSPISPGDMGDLEIILR